MDMHGLAMLVAAISAVVMSIGTQMQNSGAHVTQSNVDGEGRGGFSIGQLGQLMTRKRWLFGTLFLGVAIVLQLSALSLAPLLVVQPIGALALVITTFLNASVAHVRLNPPTLWGVALCSGGIALFVSVAAFVAVDNPITDGKLIAVLVVLAVVLAILGALFLRFHRRMSALLYVLGAGILYGFVATLAKVVIGRVEQGEIEWLTVTCVVALLLATILGGWFVQNAHASGPPDLVIAGLTVVDPLVAVTIGIVILGEANHASAWEIVAFVCTGVAAIIGVFVISKFHPQSGVAGISVINLADSDDGRDTPNR